MFSVRNQLSALATGLAAVIIAAIPVTFTFAQTYGYMPSMQQYQPQQRYLYWCNGQEGNYYSYSPCPQYQNQTPPQYYNPPQQRVMPPQYTYPDTNYQPYYAPDYQYYYPYYPNYYGYNYGSYSYAYNYNYNYAYNTGNYWSYWY